jgi:5-histidylcysteine sulfoxide synthase
MIRICEAPKRFVAAQAVQRYPLNPLLLNRGALSCLRIPPLSLMVCAGSANLPDPTVGRHLQYRSFCSFPHPDTDLRRDTAFDSANVQGVVSVDYADSMPLTGPRLDDWYTGKHPSKCPGFVADAAGGFVTSLPQVSTVTSRAALQDYFDNTWCLTEVLLGGLQTEAAFMAPPYHDLRHPMIFYYGHPAVLYVNKLRVAGMLKQGLNPYFEEIFETGVDEMSWDDLSKNKMRWPSVREVHAYRQEVYALISDLIAGLSEEQLRSGGQDSPLWALFMGFEHERIHIETSSVLIAEMPLKYVSRPAFFPPNHSSARLFAGAAAGGGELPVPEAGRDFPVNHYVEVPATASVALGKDPSFSSYGFDNEYGSKTVPHVPAFAATQHLVTNGEYLAFVRDNGYSRREFWSELGWKWKSYRNSKFPCFWVKNGPTGLPHTYNLRLIFELVEMPWDWPVTVNLHEASAFAAWKTLQANQGRVSASQPLELHRLMTEVEHHAIRRHVQTAGDADPVMGYSGPTMLSAVSCRACPDDAVALRMLTVCCLCCVCVVWCQHELVARLHGSCERDRSPRWFHRRVRQRLAVVPRLLLAPGQLRCTQALRR